MDFHVPSAIAVAVWLVTGLFVASYTVKAYANTVGAG